MEKQLIPKLRFPEFKKNWEIKYLSDLLTFKNGVNASKEEYGSGFKFINVLDIVRNEFITHDKIIGSVNISEKEFENFKVEYGDILFQRSSETREEVGQATVYLDKNIASTYGGFVIRGKKKIEYDPYFMNSLLKTSHARNEITSKSGGSTRYNIGQETLSSVKIYTTELAEQQKIGLFLTTVDERISLLTQQKEKLEQYKKGIMQQLFSQEIRFKDDNGNDFPDWEEKKLGDICKIVVGGTPRTNVKEYWNGDIGWIGSGEIKNNIIKSPTKYITELGLKKSSTILMPKGTVVLAMTGTTLGKIGILDFDTCGNQSVAGFLPSEQINSIFLFNKLQSITNQILSFAGGAAQQGINKKNIESLLIDLPSVEEQQKIASFLTAIDDQIEQVGKQIDTTTIFKKGLLQQLFV